MACPGCGGQVMTGGCINPTCGMSMGGTYVNGVKVRTASGRPLVADTTAQQIRNIVSRMTDDQVLELWDKLRNLTP